MVDIVSKARELDLPELSDAISLYEREARFCQGNPADSHLSVIYKLREAHPVECNYLEIGSLFGFSMVNAMRSKTPGKFVGIDLFQATREIAMNNYSEDVELRGLSKEKTERLVEECNIHKHQVEFILGFSQDPSVYDKARAVSQDFDIMFIDGDHTFKGCQRDFKMYSPLLKVGGFLLFDDQDYAEIHQVMNEIKRSCKEQYEWIEWPEYSKKFSGFFRKIGTRPC